MRDKGVVYHILNTITTERYVGSTLDFKRRKAEHRYKLKKKTHECQALQEAWYEFGAKCFVFKILAIDIPVDRLTESEQEYLDSAPEELLYNTHRIAGTHHSKENRKRQSELNSKPYPAFIHRDTEEIIPAGRNLTDLSRKRGLNSAHMWDVVKGRLASHKGWVLLDETKRRAHQNSRFYPALINEKLEQKIPAGRNLRKLGRDHGLNRQQISKLISGEIQNYSGWRIDDG